MNSRIIKFNNDYNHTCHPAILEALCATTHDNYDGYGLDSISEKSAALLREACQCKEAQVHFLAAGTLTNLLTISTFLRPHQAVIAAESGHICVHETGAIEATGHKILTASTKDGKISPEQIRALHSIHDNEHMVLPKLVYISQATEYGTVYTKAELTEISNLCKELDLFLFVDGARLGCALNAHKANEKADTTLEDMAKLCDAFYIGGTKNGALFGEALVLVHKTVQKDFRYLCKQRGAIMAKGWLVAAQFEALFTNGLFHSLARHANEVAQYIKNELVSLQIPLFVPSSTNQIFPILPEKTAEKLAQYYIFQTWAREEKGYRVRFVTSYETSMDDAQLLIKRIKEAL